MVTAVLFKRINNIYNASNYLFSTLCANPPYANHLKKPHTTNNLTSEFAAVCVVKNLSVYLNCERLFRLRRDKKVKNAVSSTVQTPAVACPVPMCFELGGLDHNPS